MNDLALLTSKSRLKFDANLSDREFEICEQVILGHTQLEVAEIFIRSPHTIYQTVRNAFRRTGARNISELSVWYWCRKFNVTMIISERKRRIITTALLILFALHDFMPIRTDIKEIRRIEIRTFQRKKDE
jgi:DNA-binding CsgD family transcriptional regulator